MNIDQMRVFGSILPYDKGLSVFLGAEYAEFSVAGGGTEPPPGETPIFASITPLSNYTSHVVTGKRLSSWLHDFKYDKNYNQIIFSILFSFFGPWTERTCHSTMCSCPYDYSFPLDFSSSRFFRMTFRTTYIILPWEVSELLRSINVFDYILAPPRRYINQKN